ncbi:MAG: radical SAM protein [Anaerolineaceae bacterium]|nr:cobalamin-dependent protein [Betaproteobacteria bacterium]
MANILFINPVIREQDLPRHVPYGIALLAAICIEKGHQVQVFDQNAWRAGDDTVRQVLMADKWDVIGLGGITTAYGSIKNIVKLARECSPSSLIILGGGILTSLSREMMGFLPEVDVGALGEGFVTLPEILDMVDTGKREWWKIDGTISRGEGGELILSKQRGLIQNLDSLPYPAWDLFPLEEIYFPNSSAAFSVEGMTSKRRLDLNMSYGCSLICRYCYHLGIAGDMRYETEENGKVNVQFDMPGKYDRVIRYHSPEYVVNLVKYAYDKYQIDFISFLDENLMTMDAYSKRTWLKDICRLWGEAGLVPTCVREGKPHDENCRGVHWGGTSHASLTNLEIMKVMRAAGCTYLNYGYESFSSNILKSIGKGATPENNVRSFFWTLEAGIRPIPNQMLGFPLDDFQSLRDSMDAWKRLGIVVKPHFTTPYPGCEWFTQYRNRILDQYDNDLEAFILDLGDATKITAIISENFNAVELLGLRELMMSFDYKRIDDYEKIWREAHHISEGAPSTVCKNKTNAVTKKT